MTMTHPQQPLLLLLKQLRRNLNKKKNKILLPQLLPHLHNLNKQRKPQKQLLLKKKPLLLLLRLLWLCLLEIEIKDLNH
jgi:hypothetical protein